MFKYLLIIITAITAISCSTGKIISKSAKTETLKVDSSASVIDTTKKQTITVDTNKQLYGDTLTGSLAFTDAQINQMEAGGVNQEDSLESAGIKVTVSLVPFKGGYKTKIKAIAKPKESVDTHTVINTEQKGISTENRQIKQTAVTETEKTVTKKGFPWVWAIVIGAFLIIIIIIIILKKIYG